MEVNEEVVVEEVEDELKKVREEDEVVENVVEEAGVVNEAIAVILVPPAGTPLHHLEKVLELLHHQHLELLICRISGTWEQLLKAILDLQNPKVKS